MAELFVIESTTVRPNAEVLLIPPFKEIWKRDKNKNKKYAMEEFAYIEFCSSVKNTNPYRGYSEEERSSKVSEELITKKDWVPDALVIEGCAKLKSYQKDASASYNYYLAAKKAAENIRKFFSSVDLSERDQITGKPIYQPRAITSALMDTEKVLQTLQIVDKKVQEELFESSKMKGGKEIGHFAKRESMK